MSANKTKLGRRQALELARESSRVVVAKGKSVRVFDMRKNAPDDKELLSAILGPTGNLRAPTIKAGKTLLVGFNEEEYEKVFD